MKEIKCLKDLVGLRGVCDTQETCLYVNDIAGVSVKAFAKVASEEDFTAVKKFEALRSEACRQVYSDFFKALAKRGTQVKDRISTRIKGSFKGSKTTDVNTHYRIRAKGYGGTNDTIPCLDWISLHSHAETSIEITIKNGLTEKTETVELEIGENRIKINERGHNVTVSFFADSLYTQSLSYSCGCVSSCDCSDQDCVNVRYESSQDGVNWSSSSNSPFRACVSCCCDKEAFICCYAESLAEAKRWKIVALLMEEVIYSDGKSSFIRNSKNQAEKMLAKIYGTEDPDTGFMKRSSYWSSINSAISSNNIPDSSCIDCVGARIEDNIP